MDSGIFSTWQSMLTEDAPYYVPFIAMVPIGFFAHKIFKSELYGRIADVIIALVGGYACMFGVELTLKQMDPERYYGSDAQLALELTALCAVGAALLLYLARLLLAKKQSSAIW